MVQLKSKLQAINHRIFPEKILHPPEWLVLGVNNICNLHCKMCDVGIKNTETNFAINLTGTKPLNMPIELIKLIIDQSKKYYPKVKLGYAFTEPLIYPYLVESLAYAQSKQLYTSVTTNALNLKQKAHDLVQAGLNEIFISLDGIEAIHNTIRGHKNSYGRALAGIEELLTYPNPPHISIFCVITEWNIGTLKQFVDELKHLPLRQIGFMHTNFTTNTMANEHNVLLGNRYPATYSNTEEIDLSNMDLKQLAMDIKAIKSVKYPFQVTFSPEINDEAGLDVFYNKPHLKIGKVCNDVFRNIMIKSNASVIPAHGRCYNIEIGNLYQNSLKEIWNSKVIGEFRKTLLDHGGLFPACTRCCSAF